MDLSNGKYLKHEICAFSDDWLIVYDGKYNYMLFRLKGRVLSQYKHDRLPYNDFVNQTKMTEFYATFECAIRNLCKCIANDGFLTKSKVI